MSTEKASAFVLRVVDFSETSCVVTLFTREFGKVRGLAKGGRRLKGPFESALDLLSLIRVVFLRKSSDALDLLTEAKLLRRFRGRAGDLVSHYAGYYIAELLDELTEDYDPHPPLFDVALETLAGLSESGSIPALVLRFELAALAVLGHLPSLESCSECGKTVDMTKRVHFSQRTGGVLCPRCRPGKTHVVSVSPGVIRTLVRFADLSSDAWRHADYESSHHGELRAIMNHYLANLLGHEPRTRRYVGGLA